MSQGHGSTPPRDRRTPLPAVRTGGERQGEEADIRVLPVFARELGRLGRHPFRETARLEHDAADGESRASTP